MGLLPQKVTAQIDTLHYIPPIFGVQSSITLYKIVLTTNDPKAFDVEVTNGNGSFSETFTISQNSPAEFTPSDGSTILGYPFVNPSSAIPQSNLDAVLNKKLSNHGLILRAENPFFANVMTTIPSQGEILTSKGTAGKGKEFYSGHQHMSWTTATDVQQIKTHFISIMATENNTKVDINNSRLKFHGQPNNSFSVSLDKGESYIIGNTILGLSKSCGTTDACLNDYNGTYITSDEDIVINSGSAHGGHSDTTDGSRDIGFDQTVPIEYVGKEYILVEGNGGTSNAGNEVAIVIATEPSTTITVNGTSAYSLANKGDYVVIPHDEYKDFIMHIKASESVYVYQTLAGNTSAVSPGMMFIPRLTKNATKEVQITGVNEIGSPSLYLITEDTATITINQSILETGSTTVPSNTDWKIYRLNDLSSFGSDDSYSITSTGALNAAVTFIDNVVGGGGYYSGFTLDNSNAGVGTIGISNYTLRCNKDIDLLAAGGIDYDWNADDTDHLDMIKRKNDSTYTFKALSAQGPGPFIYTVTVHVKNSLTGEIEEKEKNLSITVAQLDSTFGGDLYTCYDTKIILNNQGNAPTSQEQLFWAVNAGGSAVTTDDNTSFEKGTSLGAGNNGGSAQGITTTTGNNALYTSERYADSKLSFTHTIANGTYDLTLYFAETYSGANSKGGRVFDIEVEGEEIVSKLDIVNEAGFEQEHIVTHEVTITDGILTIELTKNGSSQGPMINAIKLTGEYIKEDDQYTWSNGQYLNSIHLESPTAFLPGLRDNEKTQFDVTYNDGHCLIPGSITVTPENCGECRVDAGTDQQIFLDDETDLESVTLASTGRGTFSHWSYVENENEKTESDSILTVTPGETTVYTAHYNTEIKKLLEECTDTVTVHVEEPEPVTPPAELEYAHIYDENGDGHADRMIVGFDRLLTSLPKSITSIDWPKEGEDKITAKEDWLEYLNDDSTAVIITFPEPFDFGTKADRKSPPSINYGKSTVTIDDHIGPIIIKVEKHLPKHRYFAIQFDTDSLEYFPNPDTLIFQLSEDVSIDKNDWETTFTVTPNNGESYTLSITERPSIDKDDESILYALMLNSPDVKTPLVGNHIGFSILNHVTDTYDNNASLQSAPLEGKNDENGRVGHTFREPIVGTDNGDRLIPVEEVPVYDAEMNILENTTTYHVPLKNNWVPPVNFDPATHKIIDRETCGADEEKPDSYQDNTSPDVFNSKCYASLVFGSYVHEGPYTAHVYVYDHLGQFLDSWKQSFGKCGELENDARESDIENYYLNDLVWDMKNSNGRRVGSGVFYWHVVIQFESGRKEMFMSSMGVVRTQVGCN